MLDFLRTLFTPPPPSGATAKERLRLVLLSDHLSLAPDVVAAMKRDLLAVISRYVEIDDAHADVSFEHRENEVAMLASVPITRVRSDVSAIDAPPPSAPEPAERTVDATTRPPRRRRRRKSGPPGSQAELGTSVQA